MKIESLIPPSLELRTKFIPVSVSRYRSYYNIFGVVTPMAILLPKRFGMSALHGRRLSMNVSINGVGHKSQERSIWGSILDYYPQYGISIVVLKSAYLANLPPNRVVPTFPLEFINYVIYKYSLV